MKDQFPEENLHLKSNSVVIASRTGIIGLVGELLIAGGTKLDETEVDVEVADIVADSVDTLDEDSVVVDEIDIVTTWSASVDVVLTIWLDVGGVMLDVLELLDERGCRLLLGISRFYQWHLDRNGKHCIS